MDAAASIRRSPSEKMRRKKLAGRQREGERGCRSGKAAFCLLLPTILVYRYTGILVKRGGAVFLNKFRGGFLSILNRRRESGRISGRQTGTEGACAAAFCIMRPFCAETLRTVFQAFRSENRLPGGCSCPESAAGRKKSAVRRKNTRPGMRKKPTDISDFCEFFFYIVCVILFKISPSESTRKSKFVCIFCGLTSKKKENILKPANRYIAYRTNEQEAEHHGSEYKFCGRPV